MKAIKFIDEYMETHDENILLTEEGFDAKRHSTFVRCYIDSVNNGLPFLNIWNMADLPDNVEEAENFIDACYKFGIETFTVTSASACVIEAAVFFEVEGAKLDGTMYVIGEGGFLGETSKPALRFTI